VSDHLVPHALTNRLWGDDWWLGR